VTTYRRVCGLCGRAFAIYLPPGDQETERDKLCRLRKVAIATEATRDNDGATDPAQPRRCVGFLQIDPRAPETQAPRGQETQAPRGQEVQAPRTKDHPEPPTTPAPRGQDIQAPRNVAKGRTTVLANARKLVSEAEMACKDGDSARAMSNARAAMELLRYLP
jgi:hypothetical protein